MHVSRYHRQIILPFIKNEGQKKLARASVLLIGCGGLGCTIANHLVRAGVGKIKVVDKDTVQLPDLQRQILFDEEDAEKCSPKAHIAAQKLSKINSQVKVEGLVCEANANNIEKLIQGVDVVLDGTDNIDARFLINQACIKHQIPWVHGAVNQTTGMSMNIVPEQTACYRCLIKEITPPQGPVPILNTIPSIIASIQATEAIKIILHSPNINTDLIYTDIWEGTFHRIKIKKMANCPTCGQRNFTFL